MIKKRYNELIRETNETKINIKLNIDGKGETKISTGIGFLDHMINQLAFHALFDLELNCKGDLYIDQHHTVEDIGICLGNSLKNCLGSKKGIQRYGFSYIPMDEALLRVVIDCSGRAEFIFHGAFKNYKIGSLESQMIPHFFKSLAFSADITLNMNILEGINDHHKAEGLFKGFARALFEAIQIEPRRTLVSSTKGFL